MQDSPRISNNYFDGLPVTGRHKAVFFIIMIAYFCEQMDNWNFGFIAPALMHNWGLTMKDLGTVFTAVTAGGVEKIVSNYGDKGPDGLRQFETRIKNVIENLAWTPAQN